MDRNRPNIRTIYCPRGCGWFREYTRTFEWMTRDVDHPMLGPVTQREVVQYDIKHHDCRETANARIRLHIRRISRNANEA